jgi:K+-transporting ATPase KdpF subunit
VGAENLIGAVIALATLVYLTYSLLHPERF